MVVLRVVEWVALTGADPAAGKGGAQIVDQWGGFQGAEPPGGGCKGAEPPCLGKFWISELNSRDLVHTFCQHHMENLLIYLNYGIGLYKNGSFIVFTLYCLVPPGVPQGVLLRPIYYFLQVRFRKQIMQYTGAARGSIVRVKAKAGVQGAEPLGGGQGAKPPEANAF